MINVFNASKNISYFDSIDEYTNYIEKAQPYDSGRDNSSHSGDYSFTGTRSFKEALNLCKYGDEELCSYIKEKTLQIDNIDTYNKIKKTLVNDVVGFMPNVPNFVIGVPNNMIRDNSTKIKSKIVNIYINLSASSGVSTERIQTNAAKYVSAIDKLEEEGYRCNVYCGNMAERGPISYGVIVKVKSDREPLNLMKMAFPLCHPSMLRRLNFKWVETIPLDFTHSGYGRPMDEDNRVQKMLKPIFRDIKITVLSISENRGEVKDVVNILKKKGMVNDDSNS